MPTINNQQPTADNQVPTKQQPPDSDTRQSTVSTGTTPGKQQSIATDRYAKTDTRQPTITNRLEGNAAKTRLAATTTSCFIGHKLEVDNAVCNFFIDNPILPFKN
jgi:hypothetical protein